MTTHSAEVKLVWRSSPPRDHMSLLGFYTTKVLRMPIFFPQLTISYTFIYWKKGWGCRFNTFPLRVSHFSFESLVSLTCTRRNFLPKGTSFCDRKRGSGWNGSVKRVVWESMIISYHILGGWDQWFVAFSTSKKSRVFHLDGLNPDVRTLSAALDSQLEQPASCARLRWSKLDPCYHGFLKQHYSTPAKKRCGTIICHYCRIGFHFSCISLGGCYAAIRMYIYTIIYSLFCRGHVR